MLHGAVGTTILRLTDKTGNLYTAHSILHRHQSGGKLLSENRVNAGQQLTITGGLQFRATIANKLESNFRVRQSQSLQHARYRITFAYVIFEELHTRRDIIK